MRVRDGGESEGHGERQTLMFSIDICRTLILKAASLRTRKCTPLVTRLGFSVMSIASSLTWITLRWGCRYRAREFVKRRGGEGVRQKLKTRSPCSGVVVIVGGGGVGPAELPLLVVMVMVVRLLLILLLRSYQQLVWSVCARGTILIEYDSRHSPMYQ